MNDASKDFAISFVLVSCLVKSVHFLQKLCDSLVNHIQVRSENLLEVLICNFFNLLLLLRLRVIWENKLEGVHRVAN